MGLVPLIVIIVCLLFKMATVPAMVISSFSAIIVGGFLNHHFKMTDGFKATFSGFNDSMIHQSHISSSVKSLLEQAA